MRVAFLGNDEWSVPSLEALARSSHEVVLTVTGIPRAVRRGRGRVPGPVAEAARRLGLAVMEVESAVEGPGGRALETAGVDVFVVVAWGEILPREVLEGPRHGAVNVHFSLLPALRGAAPVPHALLHGLTATGVTTMQMDAGLDTGPILLQAREPVRPDDTTGSLGARLAQLGGALVVKTLDGLESGALTPVPQPAEGASFAPKLGAKDRVIDWRDPAAAVVRRVRAMAPKPGATTAIGGKHLRVLSANVAALEGADAVPGTVLAADREGLIVAAGTGSVHLVEVVPAGRGPMPGDAFARGARVVAGDRFG